MKSFAAVLLISGALQGAFASGKCDGDSAHYRIMPKSIGRPEQTSPTPYPLPCDSMVVPPGQTTRIYGGAMIHFGAAPASAGKITVKGELIVEGKAANPVYLSGSVTSTEFGFVPGPHSWEGLEIDNGGSLRMAHVRLFNAPTALVLFSKNVVLQDCYFRGVSGLVLPDTSLFLDPQGQSVDRLDLVSGKAALPVKVPEAARKRDSRSSGRHTALIAAGGIGIAAMLLGAGWLALKSPDEGDKQGPTTEQPKLDPEPPMPPIPGPAGGKSP